jgi:hypothetical protein
MHFANHQVYEYWAAMCRCASIGEMVLLLTRYGLQLFAELLREPFQVVTPPLLDLQLLLLGGKPRAAVEHSRPPVRHNKSQAILAPADHISCDYFPFVGVSVRRNRSIKFPIT